MLANKSATGGSGPPRHKIRVRGPIGPTIKHAFPTLTATQSGKDTLLTGSLPDQSALYGVIHQLEASACSCWRSAAPGLAVLARRATQRARHPEPAAGKVTESRA